MVNKAGTCASFSAACLDPLWRQALTVPPVSSAPSNRSCPCCREDRTRLCARSPASSSSFYVQGEQGGLGRPVSCMAEPLLGSGGRGAAEAARVQIPHGRAHQRDLRQLVLVGSLDERGHGELQALAGLHHHACGHLLGPAARDVNDDLEEPIRLMEEVHLQLPPNDQGLLGHGALHEPRPLLDGEDHLEAVAPLLVGHGQEALPQAGLRRVLRQPGGVRVQGGHNDALEGREDPVLDQQEAVVAALPVHVREGVGMLRRARDGSLVRRYAEEVHAHEVEHRRAGGRLPPIPQVGRAAQVEDRLVERAPAVLALPLREGLQSPPEALAAGSLGLARVHRRRRQARRLLAGRLIVAAGEVVELLLLLALVAADRARLVLDALGRHLKRDGRGLVAARRVLAEGLLVRVAPLRRAPGALTAR
mmetsp:Transcript_92980/g.240219  ORF Transcript_92980/g.240219 Transcript_92980/m.240219 type:complete len:420 (+) Transcript_92980:288-1547(+)